MQSKYERTIHIYYISYVLPYTYIYICIYVYVRTLYNTYIYFMSNEKDMIFIINSVQLYTPLFVNVHLHTYLCTCVVLPHKACIWKALLDYTHSFDLASTHRKEISSYTFLPPFVPLLLSFPFLYQPLLVICTPFHLATRDSLLPRSFSSFKQNLRPPPSLLFLPPLPPLPPSSPPFFFTLAVPLDVFSHVFESVPLTDTVVLRTYQKALALFMRTEYLIRRIRVSLVFRFIFFSVFLFPSFLVSPYLHFLFYFFFFLLWLYTIVAKFLISLLYFLVYFVFSRFFLFLILRLPTSS